MKIGVNAAPLLRPHTGIGQYTLNLLKELTALDKDNQYILAVQGEVAMEFPKNVTVEVLPEIGFGGAGVRKTWWEQITVPEFFIDREVDTAFFPYPCNPWSKSWYKRGICTVVTVHDCIPWVDREYRRGILSAMYHSRSRKSVALADAVLTVSEVSKQEIVDVCGVDADKVSVVYNDAGPEFKSSVDETVLMDVLGRFGLRPGEFFLYCGGYDRRKNVEYLVSEFLHGDFTEQLVLAGGKLFDNSLYCDPVAFKNEKIVRTGFLDGEELAVLYGNCKAFVHLSRKEGFNIPLVEAANCSAPLILSDIPIHREIAGDAAVFVDIEIEGAACVAMRDADFSALAGKSRELAGRYSWKRSAQEVRDVLIS